MVLSIALVVALFLQFLCTFLVKYCLFHSLWSVYICHIKRKMFWDIVYLHMDHTKVCIKIT